MEVGRRVLGPESRETLAAMSHLANLKRRQGKYEEAQALFNQVLEIEHRVLGLDDPVTLTSSTDLGSVYVTQPVCAGRGDFRCTPSRSSAAFRVPSIPPHWLP
jgi:hypothetical protein